MYNSMHTSRPADSKCVIATGYPKSLPEHRRDAVNAYPPRNMPALPDSGSLDLGVPVLASGWKGASCHVSPLKEELRLPGCDRKSMRSRVICGAWLYQAEMDGPGSGRPLGHGGTGPVSPSGRKGQADKARQFLMPF